MFVPRYAIKPIFYACPVALQMFFDKIISSGPIPICKAVLLLTAISNILLDVWVFSRLSATYHLSEFDLT